MCPGYTIAQRMVYIMLVRLLTGYKLRTSEKKPPITHYSKYNTSKTALVAVPEPFLVKLTARNEEELEALLSV
jgi:phenylacetate 2-hydroxylase